MRTLFLVLCILLGFSIISPATAHADGMAKAMDMACQTAKPWRAIQGLPHDASALNLLTAMTQGIPIVPELVDEWVRRWDQTYNDERLDAISWCEVQRSSAKTQHEWVYWAQQMMKLENGDLRYLDRDPAGVDPDLMRRWAYLWNFYGPPRVPIDSGGASWGQIKSSWR